MFRGVKFSSCLYAIAGGAILAFGLYHIHSFSGVTEGGQLGLVLLLQHWFSVSPAISGLVINLICYLIGWRTLGKHFIFYSAVSAVSFSGIYRICEQFPPLFPGLAAMPLLAAVLGALFVGIGTGLCVRIGGAPSGDDALAMSINQVTGIKIEYIYLVSDLTVLLLSLSYIPLGRIVFSLISVVLSSTLVGVIQRFQKEATS